MRRILRRRLGRATLLALACCMTVPVGSADAATSPYGRFTITYRDASTYRWQVAEAVAVWNRAGTPFRLVPARPRTRADITITKKAYIGAPNSSVAGFGGIGFVQLSAARMKSPKTFHNGQVRIVAHELGHALGLGHSANRCAIMYSAQDYPSARRCATVEAQWDARQHCGPRAPDVAALVRMWRVTVRPVAWRGYCTTPMDPARAATGPYVAGTLTAAATQYPYEGEAQGVQLTIGNPGNTTHEIGSYGLVLVDPTGAIIQNAFRFGDWYRAVRFAPAPGATTTEIMPPCNAELPAVMRVRLASQHHDAFLSPVIEIRLDSTGADPSVPANECAPTATT